MFAKMQILENFPLYTQTWKVYLVCVYLSYGTISSLLHRIVSFSYNPITKWEFQQIIVHEIYTDVAEYAELEEVGF